ncbi:MAG TPA: hypothetical protein VF221_06035 [Chloroflexota bacterium]
MTEQEKIHTLTWSETRGHYALDNPETGQVVGSGPFSIEVLDGVWVDGHIAYSTNYDGPGCYQIADAGRPHPEAGKQLPRQPLTPERLQRIVGAYREDIPLSDAVSAVLEETVGLFRGCYFVSKDGYVLGLCTGMRVRV